MIALFQAVASKAKMLMLFEDRLLGNLLFRMKLCLMLLTRC